MAVVSCYYQTLVGLDNLLVENPYTDVFIASIHTDVDSQGQPCLHLNDKDPDDASFAVCWDQAAALVRKGTRISLMIGGAGGAFVRFFSEYETYLALFVKLLKSKPFITGVDLDVEECLDEDKDTALAKIQRLIHDLKRCFGPSFRITLAPVQGALTGEGVGMGGFSYVDLWHAEQKNIAWLNGQFYGAYTVEAFDAVVKAGFPAAKVVMGMMSCNKETLRERAVQANAIKQKYPDFGGVFLWEYFQGEADWGEQMKNALKDGATVVEVNSEVVSSSGADIIEVGNIAFDEVEVGNIVFDEVEVGNIAFDEVEVGNVEFDEVEVGNVAFDEVEVGNVEFDEVEVGNVAFDEVEVGNNAFDEVEVGNIAFDKVEVSDNETDMPQNRRKWFGNKKEVRSTCSIH